MEWAQGPGWNWSPVLPFQREIPSADECSHLSTRGGFLLDPFCPPPSQHRRPSDGWRGRGGEVSECGAATYRPSRSEFLQFKRYNVVCVCLCRRRRWRRRKKSIDSQQLQSGGIVYHLLPLTLGQVHCRAPVLFATLQKKRKQFFMAGEERLIHLMLPIRGSGAVGFLHNLRGMY